MWCIHTAVLTWPLLGKKLSFISSARSDFHVAESLLIAVQAIASHVLISFSVDETWIPRKVNLSTSFKDLPFRVEMLPLWLKHMNSVLSTLTWRPMPPAAHSRLCSRDSARAGVFTDIIILKMSIYRVHVLLINEIIFPYWNYSSFKTDVKVSIEFEYSCYFPMW